MAGSGSDPTDASDFYLGSALSGTITFAAGETTKLIVLATNPDSAVEADESFTVTLSNAGLAAIDTAAATGVIVNDDGPTSGLTLIGNSGDNTLTGEASDDIIHGLGGNDALIGGAGGNLLIGGTATTSIPSQARPT